MSLSVGCSEARPRDARVQPAAQAPTRAMSLNDIPQRMIQRMISGEGQGAAVVSNKVERRTRTHPSWPGATCGLGDFAQDDLTSGQSSPPT